MITQDFLDKYLAKDAEELVKSRYELEMYLLNHGFTYEQTLKIIEKGTKSIERLLAEDPEALMTSVERKIVTKDIRK